MHSSGIRQLDDLDLDFQEKQDISAIVFEMHDKKVTKNMINPTTHSKFPL